jgi:hypothetical protein
MICVFSYQALEAMADLVSKNLWFPNIQTPMDGSWDVLSLDINGVLCFVHRNDTADASRAVIMEQDDDEWESVRPSSRRTFVQRMCRIVLNAREPNQNRISGAWGHYRMGNRLTFYCTTEGASEHSWVAEILPAHADVCFWQLTRVREPLEQFKAETHEVAQVSNALDGWRDACSQAQGVFAQHSYAAGLDGDQSREIFLKSGGEHISDRAREIGGLTQNRSFDEWMEKLDERQLRFVKMPVDRSIKLRGPAGSGKTLALIVKALFEERRARGDGRSCKILFLTHSWSMATSVDEALIAISRESSLPNIFVMPYTMLLEEVLPAERKYHNARPIGEDSESGKELQMGIISQAIDVLRQGEWAAFRGRVSDYIRDGVSSEVGSERLSRALVWNLLIEFACVLVAEGIKPGVTAEARYLALKRARWMMALSGDADKKFVYRIYAEYSRLLRGEGYMSSDQLVSDLIGYLKTFAWEFRRGSDGYDLIFVDELHLFNEQERLALSYLARDPEQYPKIVMALDPRQAPQVVYRDSIETSATSSKRGRRGELSFGPWDAVTLRSAYRYSSQVLSFIRHIHDSFPALDFGGDDWTVNAAELESAGGLDGPKPTIDRYPSFVVEISSTIDAALAVSTAGGARAAIIVIDETKFGQVVACLDDGRRGRFSVIQSRADVDLLRYSRGTVVLSVPEYVAGMQFNTVFLVGLPPKPDGANAGFQERSFLSALYAASSRAELNLHICVDEQAGELHQVIDSARRNGILRLPT